MQQVVQARTSKNRSGTIKYAEQVIESRMKDLQAKRDEERKQQREIERWQQEEDEQAREATCQRREHESRLCPHGAMSSATAKRQQAMVTAIRQHRKLRCSLMT